MYIARVAEQFPPMHGGLASGMLALSLEQHRQGHRLTVITRDLGAGANAAEKYPFEVIRIPARSLLHFGWRAAGVLARLAERPDLVHCHGPAAAPILLRKRQGEPPVVLTLHALRRYQYGLLREAERSRVSPAESAVADDHGAPPPFRPWSPKVQRELLLERYLCRRADHLALVAAYFQPLVAEYYGVAPDRCTVIYNGSSFAGRPDQLDSLEDPRLSAEKTILYVGRLDWIKQAHLLVQAMPAILEHDPAARMALVGEGDQRAYLEGLVRSMGLQEKVLLRGWVEHTDLVKIYASAACLCLPSLWEGLPKVILEAMSIRVPVVASDIPANREVLQSGALGRLVDGADPSHWAAAISDILAHPHAASRMAQLAADAVEQRYRWCHVAQRLEGAYQQVISR